MNRKYFMRIGTVIIVAALLCAAIFLFSTKDQSEKSQGSLDSQIYELVQGDWQVAFVDQIPGVDETISFQGDELIVTRGAEVIKDGKYQIQNGRIIAQDKSVEYILEIVTEAYIKLISAMDSGTFSLIPKTNVEKTIDKNLLLGDWNVLVHGNSKAEQERICFAEKNLTMYRDGKVYLESEYSFQDGVLNLKQGSLVLKMIPLSETNIIMLDQEGGYVWQIQKQ